MSTSVSEMTQLVELFNHPKRTKTHDRLLTITGAWMMVFDEFTNDGCIFKSP